MRGNTMWNGPAAGVLRLKLKKTCLIIDSRFIINNSSSLHRAKCENENRICEWEKMNKMLFSILMWYFYPWFEIFEIYVIHYIVYAAMMMDSQSHCFATIYHRAASHHTTPHPNLVWLTASPRALEIDGFTLTPIWLMVSQYILYAATAAVAKSV